MAPLEPQPQGVGIEPPVYPVAVDGVAADPLTRHRRGLSVRLIVSSMNVVR